LKPEHPIPRNGVFGTNLEEMAVAKRKKTKRKNAIQGRDPERTIVVALLADELMNQMNDYLTHGRRFEGSNLQALHRDWVASVRGLFGDRDRKHERNYYDLTAEFQLRKIEPLYEPVRPIIEDFEAEVMRRLNLGVKLVSRELKDKIDKVLREEKKPKH
jgi:hypothetical protein